MNHSEIVSFLWGVADLIRDTFKRGKYQDVILPLTVLRRLDCVLAGTKERVLKRQGELRGKGLKDLDAQLRRASGFAFYNTSRYDFEKLLADAPHLAANENPGEHFTPRDVVHLMVDLMLAGDEARIRRRGIVCTVYDPCCGSGGMLMIAKEHITGGLRKNGGLLRPAINKDAEIHLFGQEVNPETWAVSKSDLFMKDPTGRDADNIAYGSTLSNDRHAGNTFDYLIANPPYGKDWKRDEDAVRAEHERGTAGRFGPGLPRISDGQLLFLLHMLAHAKDRADGGSRIAIIMNGSPLFTGDAGSGESEIRRFIFENDLLEALIALPEQLFYNTGIATYVWVVTNRKAAARKRKVQLIDATSFWTPMRKSLGDKRREIPLERALDIVEIRAAFRDGETRTVKKNGKEDEVVVSRIFPTTHFGFRKITVERPLRLNFQASPERIARLEQERGFLTLAQSRKKGAAGAREQAEGMALLEAIRKLLRRLPDALIKDREKFVRALDGAIAEVALTLPAPARKAILSALAGRDETAAICRGKDGRAEPVPSCGTAKASRWRRVTTPGTQAPAAVWLAIPHKARVPGLSELRLEVVRFSGAAWTFGVKPTTFEGVAARITTPARTVADCFRFERLLGPDVPMEALQDALRQRKVTVAELSRVEQVLPSRRLRALLDARSI